MHPEQVRASGRLVRQERVPPRYYQMDVGASWDFIGGCSGFRTSSGSLDQGERVRSPEGNEVHCCVGVQSDVASGHRG